MTGVNASTAWDYERDVLRGTPTAEAARELVHRGLLAHFMNNTSRNNWATGLWCRGHNRNIGFPINGPVSMTQDSVRFVVLHKGEEGFVFSVYGAGLEGKMLVPGELSWRMSAFENVTVVDDWVDNTPMTACLIAYMLRAMTYTFKMYHHPSLVVPLSPDIDDTSGIYQPEMISPFIKKKLDRYPLDRLMPVEALTDEGLSYMIEESLPISIFSDHLFNIQMGQTYVHGIPPFARPLDLAYLLPEEKIFQSAKQNSSTPPPWHPDSPRFCCYDNKKLALFKDKEEHNTVPFNLPSQEESTADTRLTA